MITRPTLTQAIARKIEILNSVDSVMELTNSEYWELVGINTLLEANNIDPITLEEL